MGNTGRTHHLLKHKLPEGDVREHFGSTEPREVMKEIGRMGQRELQAKFRAVYGGPTYSNNNNWLRRKLMEAAGLQPQRTPARARTKPQPACVAGGDVERQQSAINQRAVTDSGAPLSAKVSQPHDAPETNSQGVRRTSRVRRPKLYEDMVYHTSDSLFGHTSTGDGQFGLGLPAAGRALQASFDNPTFGQTEYQPGQHSNRSLQARYPQGVEHKPYRCPPAALESAVAHEMALLNERLKLSARANGPNTPGRVGPHPAIGDHRFGWQGIPPLPAGGRPCNINTAVDLWPHGSGDCSFGHQIQLPSGTTSPSNTDAFSSDTTFVAGAGATSAPAQATPTAGYRLGGRSLWSRGNGSIGHGQGPHFQELESTCTAEENSSLGRIAHMLPLVANDDTSLLLGDLQASTEMEEMLAPSFVQQEATGLGADLGYPLSCRQETTPGLCHGYEPLESMAELPKLF